jgi:hypothetical protein
MNETNPTASSIQGTRRQFLSLTTAAGAALFATSATAFATSEVSMMDLPPASSAIAPFKINIPNAATLYGWLLTKISCQRGQGPRSTPHARMETAWPYPISPSWNWPHSSVRAASASISVSNPSCRRLRLGSSSYRSVAVRVRASWGFQQPTPRIQQIELLEPRHWSKG